MLGNPKNRNIIEKILWIGYQPYKWLILVPVFMATTSFFGALAVVLCMFLPPRIPSYLCGATWAKINGYLTPIFVKIRGKENIDKKQSYVIVSNHQSQYDIFVLYGWLGIDFKWVMKKELRKAPFIGISCEKIGHIFVDRSNKKAAIESINNAKKRIVNGTSVIFFPEGTRSRTNKMRPFKKGAFRMAKDLNLPILPITIKGTRDILPPDTFDIFPGKVEVIVHEPVDTADFNKDNIMELMAEVRKIIEGPLNASKEMRS